MMSEQVAQLTPASGFEDAAMSGATTLVGLSGIPDSNQPLPDMGVFDNDGQPFNVFSDTLFDFDMADVWNTGNFVQF